MRIETRDELFDGCFEEYCNLKIAEPIVLKESVDIPLYETYSKSYGDTDFLGIYFEPCVNTTEIECGKADWIHYLLDSDLIRIRYDQKDDVETTYQIETPLPKMGNAMSLFVREVVTVEEDYHYLLGYAFINLFTDIGDGMGVKRE